MPGIAGCLSFIKLERKCVRMRFCAGVSFSVAGGGGILSVAYAEDR